jgi:hypothetical protein
VKIAASDDTAGTPSNNPHVGCTFYIEWFGYDQGDDVVSTVSFTPQAPTSDVTIGGTSPSQVFVGGDPAGGGTDLDGRQAYTLSFSGGAPHPQQGYHVKVTVSTPHSLGNDTKTKVFWVEPCTTAGSGTSSEAPGTGAGDTPSDAPSDTPTDTATDLPGAVESSGAALPGGSTSTGPDQGVEASSLSAPTDEGGSAGSTGVSGREVASGSAVPTSVDAGENSPLPDWARSPLPLALVVAGLVVVAGAMVARNRSRA